MEVAHESEKINNDIQFLTRLLSQTPYNHTRVPLLLTGLGLSHDDRFYLLNDLEDLKKAIGYMTVALTLTPENDPELSELLFSLASAHLQRFQQLGDLYDIERAINYGHVSVDLTPDGDPSLPIRLVNLGSSYNVRCQHLGNQTDVENAIKYQSRALAATPDGHPNLPRSLNSLGVSHSLRFEHLGELKDVENAIEYQLRALALAPDGYPHLPGILIGLGNSHSGRYDRLHELGDLERAIKYKSRAVSLTPDGHPNFPLMLTNLGGSQSVRFERLGKLSDLEDSKENQSRAVAMTPDGHPLLPSRLANLGLCYYTRFRQLGERNDLDDAIVHLSRALALTPKGHPDFSTVLANLAVCHTERFDRFGEPSDLETAITLESRAIDLTPDEHPSASGRRYTHAHTHMRYYELTKNTSDFQQSLHYLHSASQLFSGPPRDRFKHAKVWAMVASVLSPDSGIEAYQTTINLLPQFIWLGATTSQRYEDLAQTENLAIDAASAAIHVSEYGLALEWLEHARCVVWNQSLMLRSPVDELLSMHPDLGGRLQTVANQLHNLGSDSCESRALVSSTVDIEQVAQEHRRLAIEYDSLLRHIRQVAGFEDFLRPMKVKRLVQAARTGPVVVLNCDKDQCDALLALPGGENVEHVSLPGFSARKAGQARHTIQKSLRRKGVRERGVKAHQQSGQNGDMFSVLANLWYNIVKPILYYLGYMNNRSSGGLPHITWCPTGALSFLPLHAAGDYDQPQSRVFDYVISSYTPTLAALLASTSGSLSNQCRVLAIGQMNTPGHSALPGTATELAYVQARTKDNAGYSQLIDSEATVPAVIDAMEQHDWVHLACHAYQNLQDPTQSGFFLHGGTLDLVAINRQSFKGKGLAFLSACQTATGDEKLADEAVHLASGMLMAGYSSVIGTMWSVHDADAPLVADKVYVQLMKDRKVGNGEAGRALHNAVGALRETVGESKFERWVPYIHIGS